MILRKQTTTKNDFQKSPSLGIPKNVYTFLNLINAFYCENNVNTLLLQPFSAQMAGLDEKSGLGSQVGLMPGSVVSANITDN